MSQGEEGLGVLAEVRAVAVMERFGQRSDSALRTGGGSEDVARYWRLFGEFKILLVQGAQWGEKAVAGEGCGPVGSTLGK